MKQTKSSWITKLAVFALIIFCGFLYIRLGRDYLFDWDESIYAELGRSILRGASWLTPNWNGTLWLEKPPLIAWFIALSLKLFGINEFGARFFMPIFSAATLTSVFVIGKKMVNEKVGLIAASLLGYFDLFLVRARTVNTDSLLMAGITGTVALLIADAPPVLVALAASIAVMDKGPVGLLAIVISLPLFLTKSKKFILHTTYFILLFILPWHLYQLVVHGSAFYTPYLLEQVVRRATTPIEFHLESRWFYFIFLYKDLGLGMLIGTLVGMTFLVRDIILKYQKSHNLSSHIYHLTSILWWILFPLAAFTLARTRLSWYILPIYPALALSIAYGLHSIARSPKVQKVLAILMVGIVLQTLRHAYMYSDPGRTTSTLPDQLVVAQKLKNAPGDEIAMLVSQSERTAQAILPESQAISSSFRYGGAPSMVWYADKQVKYYYNYDLFTADLVNHAYPLVIVTNDDTNKVPAGYIPLITTKSYSGYGEGNKYAER